MHLAYLQDNNKGSSSYLIIPLKIELLDDLQQAKIDTLFDDKKGIQIKISNAKDSEFVISLLKDPSNLTNLFYNSLQQWYDLFNRGECEPILNNHFEYTDPELPTSYKSNHPPMKPDLTLSLKMTGLEEDILNIPLIALTQFETYLINLGVCKVDEMNHCEGYPERSNGHLSMDLGFRILAENVLKEFPPTDNIFYIVNTGHSIPVGSLMLSSYQIPCTVFMRQIGLSTIGLYRVTSQITSFASEIQNSPSITSSQSFAWLLDCHVGEFADYDQKNMRGIRPFQPRHIKIACLLLLSLMNKVSKKLS